jgi:hypothetical protein
MVIEMLTLYLPTLQPNQSHGVPWYGQVNHILSKM